MTSTAQGSAPVIWITGLSGAGKTTVARLVADELRSRSVPVVFLDGDELRNIFGNDLGHSRADRLKVAKRNANLCKHISDQAITVVMATISLFHEVHLWNRENVPGYLEIYLEAPFDVLKERDSKGVYHASSEAAENHVFGADISPEIPTDPHLRIQNFGARSENDSAREILEFLNEGTYTRQNESNV